LLGVPHIFALSVSLDFALSHPGCELEEAMAFGLSPVFSQSEAPRKAGQTSLFCPPLSDILAVSSCVFCAALLTSLLGLTWGLKGVSSPSESPLTLLSLFALWGTVFVGFLSLVGSNTTGPRESYLQTSGLAGADLMRGRTRLPLRHTSPNLPREDSRLSPDMRGYLAHMNERDFASVFPPPRPSLPLPKRGGLFARREGRPSRMAKKRL
jgi:hypothetical protein